MLSIIDHGDWDAIYEDAGKQSAEVFAIRKGVADPSPKIGCRNRFAGREPRYPTSAKTTQVWGTQQTADPFARCARMGMTAGRGISVLYVWFVTWTSWKNNPNPRTTAPSTSLRAGYAGVTALGRCSHGGAFRFAGGAVRQLVQDGPEPSNRFDGVGELLKVDRFHHVGVGSQAVTLVHIQAVAR